MFHNYITTNQKHPEHFILFITEVRDRTMSVYISYLKD